MRAHNGEGFGSGVGKHPEGDRVMNTKRTIGWLVALGIASPLAMAQDYGDQRDTVDNAIRDDAVVSGSIAGFAGGNWELLNNNGYVEVPKSSFDDPQFTELGEIETDQGTGTDTVEAAWWDVVLPEGTFLKMVFRTQNGSQFVPFGSTKNGNDINAYTYEMGGDGNGVDLRSWVTSFVWKELTVSYSFDGGQTVFSDPTIPDPIGDGTQWDGTDAEHLGLAFPGDGVNWIQASYRYEAVPTPGSAMALLLSGGLFASRRRRS